MKKINVCKPDALTGTVQTVPTPTKGKPSSTFPETSQHNFWYSQFLKAAIEWRNTWLNSLIMRLGLLSRFWFLVMCLVSSNVLLSLLLTLSSYFFNEYFQMCNLTDTECHLLILPMSLIKYHHRMKGRNIFHVLYNNSKHVIKASMMKYFYENSL